MTFDINALNTSLQQEDKVARVVIADIKGSSPREVGAAMLVWQDGQSGTIGGGALEYDAAAAARRFLAGDKSCMMTRHALGPDLGQCCGGHVTLLTEVFDKQSLFEFSDTIIARPAGDDMAMPLSVSRVLARARNQGSVPAAQLLDGWMIEPVLMRTRPVWIWGAGHVGRALVDVLAALPDLDLTWIDTGPERFPVNIPADVTVIPQKNPGDIAMHAPTHAHHFILTYSHALDLDLCHRLLLRGFDSAGLIGSQTKWARFRKRLGELGHSPDQIARITCPIGDPALGKHPAQIAIGVAHDLITQPPAAQDKEQRA
jgi:xanthine dehydrogenase accessory factor